MRYLLHDIFIDSVKKFPNNQAIYEECGKSITYEELNDLANRFAHFYMKNKESSKNHPFVGILSNVHAHSIAAVIGALKIGCAYVPLDEHSPVERLLHILKNTDLDILVVDPFWYEKHKELLSSYQLKKIIFLNSVNFVPPQNVVKFEQILECPSKEPPLLNQVSDDLAYILHSSGSTGIPKGIMLTHRNARTFVDWMQKEFQLTEKDVVISRAPFKFDLSIFDIFNTFKAGAKLVCYDWKLKREENEKHSSYVKLMENQKVTILYTTPSTFITLMNKGNLVANTLCLREIMYAGEPFPVPQLRKLKELLPNVKIANIYGPTETNIITYYWIDQLPDDNEAIPLGHEVDDTEILVVCENKKTLCKPEEIGELWCRGGTVTLGYLGMEEATKSCLVQSPFHKYPAKFWRTGDYGYRDEKGVLHYKGRRDHMVKVKGYRIEIGEVESALSQISALEEFAVVAIPNEKYGNSLYCFFSVLPGNNITEEGIKGELSKRLPEYMIPFGFFKKESLAKTSSGKIDRVLLMEKANLNESKETKKASEKA
jgi:amino acid adenylation domain-containing protein